jgi:hypothetical protein
LTHPTAPYRTRLLRLGLTLGLLLGAASASAAPEWEDLGTRNGIHSFRKSEAGSSLFSFRGEGWVNAPIAVLTSLIVDPKYGPEWVDLMVKNELARTVDPNTVVMYQSYDMPWPVEDRDFVLKQAAAYDPEKKVVTVRFESTTEGSKPEDACCVRGQVVRTYWRLSVDPRDPNRTWVEGEVAVNPKGSLPDWLINLIQKSWPYNSIDGLRKRTAKGGISPAPQVAGW